MLNQQQRWRHKKRNLFRHSAQGIISATCSNALVLSMYIWIQCVCVRVCAQMYLWLFHIFIWVTFGPSNIRINIIHYGYYFNRTPEKRRKRERARTKWKIKRREKRKNKREKKPLFRLTLFNGSSERESKKKMKYAHYRLEFIEACRYAWSMYIYVEWNKHDVTFKKLNLSLFFSISLSLLAAMYMM